MMTFDGEGRVLVSVADGGEALTPFADVVGPASPDTDPGAGGGALRVFSAQDTRLWPAVPFRSDETYVAGPPVTGDHG
jgi:hypothetical protein